MSRAGPLAQVIIQTSTTGATGEGIATVRATICYGVRFEKCHVLYCTHSDAES